MYPVMVVVDDCELVTTSPDWSDQNRLIAFYVLKILLMYASSVVEESFCSQPILLLCRNLEMMDIAYKRRGWAFQAPRKDFYHK